MRTDLHKACKVVVRFTFIKLESKKGITADVEKIMTLLRDIKELFEMQIKENDKEAWEAAGLLNYDFCELCCKL
jgi:hypothetical protein